MERVGHEGLFDLIPAPHRLVGEEALAKVGVVGKVWVGLSILLSETHRAKRQMLARLLIKC